MNTNIKPPQLDGPPRLRTLVGGAAVVATGLAAWWYGLLRYESRKEERGEYKPWEYRILQAQVLTQNAEGSPTVPKNNARPGKSSSTPATVATHPDVDVADSPSARADKVQDAQTKTGRSPAHNADPRPGPEPTQ